MEMLQNMAERIQANDSLAIRKLQGTFSFVDGEPVASEIVDLNKMEGLPEMPKGKMTALELLIASAGNCYATTLHKNAFVNKIPLNKVNIQVTGKFDQRRFFGLSNNNPGMIEPEIVLSVESPAKTEIIENIAKISLTQSPVLMSLNQKVSLQIQ